MTLKPREKNTKQKGIINSTTNTVVELADMISETAEAGRRVMKISNSMLMGLEAEVYLDNIQVLVDKGLTTPESIKILESMR